MPLQRAGHAVGVGLVAQLARRRVDRDPRRQVQRGPLRRLTARLLDHPGADARDQAGLLGVRDELVGRHEPLLGIVPAHQRLDPEQRARAEVVDGLVVEPELVLGQRAPQPRGERQAAVAVAGVLRVEGIRVAAGALGLVHRGVGVLEQLSGDDAVVRADRDADRGSEPELGSVEHERVVERGQDLGGHRLGAGRLDAGADQHELVAAQPGQQVAGAGDVADALGDLDEHLVPGGVPERVVDELEVVEVDVQRRDRRRRRAARGRARGPGAPRRWRGWAAPVSRSWNARWASRSSERCRSVTSIAIPMIEPSSCACQEQS